MLAQCSKEPERTRHIDSALAVITFALAAFAGEFKREETIIAQLLVDRAFALLLAYGGEAEWPRTSEYALARIAAAKACASAGTVHKMAKIFTMEQKLCISLRP